MGHRTRACSCRPDEVARYRARISGPLMDRIDLHVEVPCVTYDDLSAGRRGEPSAVVRERVNRCRALQRERFGAAGIRSNGCIPGGRIRDFCGIDGEGERLLRMVVDRLGMSARAYDRILKVARTIADLEQSERVGAGHIGEAIHYRSLDRGV